MTRPHSAGVSSERHRRLAGVEPTTVVYGGDDLADFVLSKNNRRNVTAGQRAMATAVILKKDGRRIDGRWVRGSVVNPDSGINLT